MSECDTVVDFDGVPRGIATPDGSSVAGSEYYLVRHRGGSTEAGETMLPSSSNHTTAGYSGDSAGHGLFAGRVYAADSVDDGASMDGFAVVGREEGVDVDEEENAKRVVEAMERAEAEREMGTRKRGLMEDENYADLWGGDMDEEDQDEDEDEIGGMEDCESEGSDDTVMVDGEEEEEEAEEGK